MSTWEHPDEEVIKKYIWQELDEENEIFIGEHLADCEECASFARVEAEFRQHWESFNPQSHGASYWQKRINEALEQLEKDSSSFLLTQRIQQWKGKFKSRFGSMLRMIRSGADGMLDAAAGLAGNFSFLPAQPVRGLGADSLIRFQVPEGVPLEVAVDKGTGAFRMKIEDSLEAPPLVLLLFKAREPVVLLPEKVEGTAFYSLAYVPEEDCCLFVEPV